MKLITYRYEGEERVGAVLGEEVAPVAGFSSMNELLEAGITTGEIRLEERRLPFAAVTLCAPIPVPRQDVLCLGVNYMDHAYESAKYKKEDFHGDRPYPVYFCKRVNEITPDGGLIDGHFDIQERLDYESELAVVIGKPAYHVAREDAWDYVFGYSILNDVSSRDLQMRHKQFYFGKSLDTFTCMGPWIVTKDELACPPVLEIGSRVNGELRQHSSTGNLIFDIPYIIEDLSAGMTLKPGTIIATGTPSGVAMGFDPPKWMRSGDTVECFIEGIGVLRNTVM